MPTESPPTVPLIVIPYFNHPRTLRQVAQEARQTGMAVLIVDDGSSTPAEPLLAGLDVSCLRVPANRGKGAAIQTAAEFATAHGFTHLITLDADGQHCPAEAARFRAVAEESPWAITVGTRQTAEPDGRFPAASRFGRSFSNFWFRLQTGQKLEDTQSGFRCYPVAVLRGLRLHCRRYTFEAEVLVKAAWAGVPLRAIDITVFYPDGDLHVSHFKRFKDNFWFSVLNTHLTMRSLLPLPHRRLHGLPGRNGGISLLHPWRSLRTALQESADSVSLGSAAALGVILGATPLIGLHTVAILASAGYMRLNRAIAVAASQLCMPPLVPALCIETGYVLRHGRLLTELSLQTLGREAHMRLLDWLLGSLLVGPLLAAVTGGVVCAMAASLRKATAP
jgi:uncharacterized protein (DUF2062 family)